MAKIKIVLIIIGFISLGLGIIGIVLPVLPTTPFLLLSAYLFSKSSDRFYNFLTTNRVFGKYITDYQDKKGITLKNKVIVLVFLAVTISVSILKVDSRHLQIFLGVVFVAVSYHILKLKTLKETDK